MMDWAAEITACWRASVESIFQVGRLLIAAKEALPHGQFGKMIEDGLPFTASTAQRLMVIAADVRLSNPAHVQLLPPSWGTLYELTKLPDEEFETRINDGTICPEMRRRDVAHAAAGAATVGDAGDNGSAVIEAMASSTTFLRPDSNSKPEEMSGDDERPLPSGSRAIMASRQEPDDSLDFFPTPPWATRALCELVLPRYAVTQSSSVWEPACGAGHMAEVLREYFREVEASDIGEYRYSDHDPCDFLDCVPPGRVDWIITNPPFEDKAEAFVLRAIKLAQVGVAMFLRLQWLETVGRYERIFKPHPPALIAQFAERVPLCKGRWDPGGSTATAYLWIVWSRHHRGATEFFWIPPGQRAELTRPDDAERFTAHPVARRIAPIGEPVGSKPLICNGEGEPVSDPSLSAGSPMGADQWSDLDIPNYLKRSPDAPECSFPSLERASVTPAVESRESESPAGLSLVAE